MDIWVVDVISIFRSYNMLQSYWIEGIHRISNHKLGKPNTALNKNLKKQMQPGGPSVAEWLNKWMYSDKK